MASCCLLGKERVWEGQEEADDDSRHLLRMCSAGDLCSIVFPEMTDISLWQPSKPDETQNSAPPAYCPRNRVTIMVGTATSATLVGDDSTTAFGSGGPRLNLQLRM